MAVIAAAMLAELSRRVDKDSAQDAGDAHLAINLGGVREGLEAGGGEVVAHGVVDRADDALGEERALAVLVDAEEQDVQQLRRARRTSVQPLQGRDGRVRCFTVAATVHGWQMAHVARVCCRGRSPLGNLPPCG